MSMSKIVPTTIDEYITIFPPETQKKLEQMRQLIHKLAPTATEVISYQMPAFKLNSVFVYFAGYKNHIGFYPTSTGIKNFEKEFAKYKWSKGAVQFPLDEPLPVALITKMVKFKIKEDKEKANAKKNLKICKKGHQFIKSSDCPVCPICEQERKSKEDLYALLSAPARRALENKGIHNLKQLSKFSEDEILALHGMGPSTIPKLKKALMTQNLSFKQL